jgi:hypothetical protein
MNNKRKRKIIIIIKTSSAFLHPSFPKLIGS